MPTPARAAGPRTPGETAAPVGRSAASASAPACRRLRRSKSLPGADRQPSDGPSRRSCRRSKKPTNGQVAGRPRPPPAKPTAGARPKRRPPSSSGTRRSSSAPATGSARVVFRFGSDQAGATFLCRVDGALPRLPGRCPPLRLGAPRRHASRRERDRAARPDPGRLPLPVARRPERGRARRRLPPHRPVPDAEQRQQREALPITSGSVSERPRAGCRSRPRAR